MTAEIPEELRTYIAARDRERSERVLAALEALTPRERLLIKEAAVMGYVQGVMAPDSAIPTDSIILRNVVAGCLDASDLYPVIGGGRG